MAPPKKTPPRPATAPAGSGAPPKPVAQEKGKPSPAKKGNAAAEKKKAEAKTEATLLKTFTGWWETCAPADSTQQMTGTLVKDLASGVIPLALLEALTGQEIKHNKPKDEKPLSRVKMIENQNFLLKALKGVGVKLTCTAEDLADGKAPHVIALSWAFVMFEGGISEPGGAALLEWVGQNVAGLEGVSTAEGWASCLKDGRLVGALVHRFDSNALDFDAMKPGRSPDAEEEGGEEDAAKKEEAAAKKKADAVANAVANLNAAFGVAAKGFGVPRLLDAAEVASGEAELKSLITYVAKMRSSFRAFSLKRRAEVMERCAAFEAGAKAVEEWASTEKAELLRLTETVKGMVGHGRTKPPANEEEAESVRQAEAMKVDLDEVFRAVRKPGRISSHEELMLQNKPLLHSLSTLLEAEGSFVLGEPPAGSASAAAPKAYDAQMLNAAFDGMQASWSALETAEAEYEAALYGILTERVTDIMLAEIDKEVAVLTAWANDCTARYAATALAAADGDAEGAAAGDEGAEAAAGASGPALLQMDEERHVWPAGADCAAAAKEVAGFLKEWSDPHRGVGPMAERKQKVLAKLEEATARRASEEREPPAENIAPDLEAAWGAQTQAVLVLRRKMDWALGYLQDSVAISAGAWAASKPTLTAQLPEDPLYHDRDALAAERAFHDPLEEPAAEEVEEAPAPEEKKDGGCAVM